LLDPASIASWADVRKKSIDKKKRALGGAIKRTTPSVAAAVLSQIVRGRVLDFGCGHGYDAGHFGWESYDPYYRPKKPEGPFNTIVCIGVINALSRNNRAEAIEEVRSLLTDDGLAYFAVPRNLPKTGKLGIHHSLQNYVVLTLESVYATTDLEIYVLRKGDNYKDKTQEYLTPRDRRSLRR
jgi:hypothetical protein